MDGWNSDSFLAAMWLECYVLLHYFERARGPKDAFWNQVGMKPSNLIDSFLAAMWLECYVLLHYFERARGPKGGFWNQVKLRCHKVPSTVPRFCLGKTEVCCVFGSN